MQENKILDLLKLEISELEYTRYIKHLKFSKKDSTSTHIVYIAPNLLVANWVKTKYSKRIIKLFKIEINVKITIEIRVENKTSTSSKNNTLKQLDKLKNEMLNPLYTFENFVVGSSNQYAYAVSKAIAEKPGILYNPVFIYGSTGLGKTHLMNAIGNYAQSIGKAVIYATIEQFLNDFTYHLQNSSMVSFRKKYRECDVLLVDDVQFLSGKVEVQKEFFNTFNELHSSGKQVVLASDKPYKKINDLEERLKSRFGWGLIADVTMPELKTKIEIIKKKCELDNIDLHDKIIYYIATNMGENIREIESAIINLNAYATLMRQDITFEFAKNVLKEQLQEKNEIVTVEDIISVVSRELNIKPSEIKSKKRTGNITKARRICIYLAREVTSNSTPSIASYFNMKDHTAISHNIKKTIELMKDNEVFKLIVEDIKCKVMTFNTSI